MVHLITVDALDSLNQVIDTLGQLSSRAVHVRLVCDPETPATDYQNAVQELSKVSTVMICPVDSKSMPLYDQDAYSKRFTEYLDVLPKSAALIFEVGNEVNGDWLGKDAHLVASMVHDAHRLVKKAGRRAWLTPYNFGDSPHAGDNDMLKWLGKWLPADSLLDIDYVGISDYPVDWGVPNGHRNWDAVIQKMDWPAIFKKVADMYPSARIGWGECGWVVEKAEEAQRLQDAGFRNVGEAKMTIVRYYYSHRTMPGVPRWMLGGGWWPNGQSDFIQFNTSFVRQFDALTHGG